MSSKLTVGICVSEIEKQPQRDIVKALCDYAKKSDITFLILSTYTDLSNADESAIGESSIFRLIGKIHFDALIVFADSIHCPNVLKRIFYDAKKDNTPIICVGEKIDGYPSVLYNTVDAFEKIVRHVFEFHGCRRVNFIAGEKDNYASIKRFEIYKQLLDEKNIAYEPERVGYGEFKSEPVKKVMDDFFSCGKPLPEAIICANDVMAMTANKYLIEKGITAPDDIILTGFDGIDMEKYHFPRLTTASPDSNYASELLFRLILDACQDKKLNLVYYIPYTVRFSQSCGCKRIYADIQQNAILDLWTEINDTRNFTDYMLLMISSVTGKSNIEESIESIKKFMQSIYAKRGYLFSCDNYLKMFNVADCSEICKDMTDRMCSVLECRIENKNFPTVTSPKRVFNLCDILPDAEDYFSHWNTLVMMPLTFRNYVFGYIAFHIDLVSISITQLREFGMNIGYILEKIRSLEHMKLINKQLEETYIYDSMTGILNRNGYYALSKRDFQPYLKTDKQLVAVSIDLDNLKEINDNHGHHCGDTALKITADSLTKCMGENSLCTRFGGDEFVGLRIFDNDTSAFVSNFSEEFLQSIYDATDDQKLDFDISASLGIVSIPMKSLNTIEEAIRSADVIMYSQKKAKKKGRR